jgi:ABC-type phosphate/phosphonate transport system substrate-binding protein
VRADSPIKTASELTGKLIGVGAEDSPQATLIPLSSLAALGVEGTVVRHDVLNGKHGDHIGGERDAVKALLAGSLDAACIIDGNRLAFTREGLIGTAGPTAVRVVHQTGAYDHCNFTVLDNPHPHTAKFTELLLGMSYDDATLRPLLDMEGLKKWLPGRVSGYVALEQAVDRYRYLESWLSRVAA